MNYDQFKNLSYNQFKNLSCYEEFEIQTTLTGISKIDILKRHAHKIDNYYFFVSNDGIFNWFDFEGNHIENPGVLKDLTYDYIPVDITKCIIPNSVTCICKEAFSLCKSLTSINIPDNVTAIGYYAFSCTLLTSITIADSVKNIGDEVFFACHALKEVIFKGKTLEQVKQMKNYPFGIEDESIIKCEL